MARRYSIKSRPNSWVVRDKSGRFKDWHKKSKSVPLDRRAIAKNKVKAGYGHLGDQPKFRRKLYIKKTQGTPRYVIGIKKKGNFFALNTTMDLNKANEIATGLKKKFPLWLR